MNNVLSLKKNLLIAVLLDLILLLLVSKHLMKVFSSKNYVRKFLRALHPKWRAKVTTIEESKDLSSLALDELIGNLKVHDVDMEKDSEIYKGKKERVKSIALKAKKESSDDETSTSESDDEEYTLAARVIGDDLDAVIRIISLANVQSLHETRIKKHLLGVLGAIAKMKSRTKPMKKLLSWLNHLMRRNLEFNEKIKKLERNKEVDISSESCQQLRLENSKLKETQVKFVKFDKIASSLREMLNVQKSSSCKIGLEFDKSKVSTRGKKPISFVGSTTDLAGDGSTLKTDGSTVLGSIEPLTSQKVCLRIGLEPDEWIKDSSCSKHMTRNKCLFSTYKAYDGDHGREFDNEVQFGAFCDAQGITHNFSAPRTPQSNGVVERKNPNERNVKVNNNNIEDESIEVDEVVNIKEFNSHPLEQVIETKNVNEALGDESWVIAMQEELY
ncbi:UBN2 domain-containing protein [Tanacetum coccineum]|uniref:UBN2 domain-containing protein n=1 Tax=Tanacetum coccineum TaxID=301880 RepID=A0ABQ4ZUJ0_9ASTR